MKISLLPTPIQDQINRRLDAGEDQAAILAWLQSLPEVQALTPAFAHVQPLTQTDLTDWKQTLCPSDPRATAALQSLQTVTAQAAEIRRTVSGPVTDQIAACFAANLAEAWLHRPIPKSDSDSPLQPVKEIARYLFPLRRGDQHAEWLEIKRQRLILANHLRQDRLDAQKAAAAPSVRGPRPEGGFTKETIAQIERDLNLF